MASVARIEDKASPFQKSGRAQRLGPGAKGLSAFRTMASVQYDRSLSMLIESEIIPRLMIAHADDKAEVNTACIVGEEITALAPLALAVDADALLAHIEAILARGVTVDTLMVDLLGPTARLLGEYWEEDRCDFVDVTMGLWRLQEVVCEIAARCPADRMLSAGGHRALFASMPGDQHSFGTVVIDEVFRRDGWVTDRMSAPQTPELVKRVGEDWFDLIGLTVSCDSHLEALTSVIAALRTVSRNRYTCIMVGGPIFSADPGLARQVGADGTASDAINALRVAADLVRARETMPLEA